jgi:hypothetical protein
MIGHFKWNFPYETSLEILPLAKLWVGDYSIHLQALYIWTYFPFPQLWPMLFICSPTDEHVFPQNSIFCFSKLNPLEL